MGPPSAEDGSSPAPFLSRPSQSSSWTTYRSGPSRRGATAGLTAEDTLRSGRSGGELKEEGDNGESCLNCEKDSITDDCSKTKSSYVIVTNEQERPSRE
jgi:hypothetical protein